MDIQLFNQFEAVESATPLLMIDNGNTSLGKTQEIGSRETPYTAVNVYIQLYTQPNGVWVIELWAVEK